MQFDSSSDEDNDLESLKTKASKPKKGVSI
jgi:hypothetical protein